MMKLRLGLDNGNFYTKGSVNGNGMKYQSGYVAVPSADALLAASHKICYDNKYFAVGDRRNPVEYNKTYNDDMMIQSLPFIGSAIASAELDPEEVVTLELCVGTPIGSYAQEAAQYREYFLDRVLKFEYNGKPYNACISRVVVGMQGYSVYLANYAKYAKYRDLNVVDIGGRDIEFFKIEDGIPVQESFITLEQGVIKLTNRCNRELERNKIKISESMICDSIQEKEINHVHADLINTVTRTIRTDYLKKIAYMLRENDMDWSLPTIVLGGGTMMLQPFLGKYFNNIIGIYDEYENARAYEKLLARKGL